MILHSLQSTAGGCGENGENSTTRTRSSGKKLAAVEVNHEVILHDH
jgi:hypothetical protein